MNRLIKFAVSAFLLASVGASAFTLDLIIVGPPKAVLHMQDGTDAVLDPNGKFLITGLESGEKVIFSTEIPGRFPADYSVEMGELDKTFRIDPPPKGVIAGELKFTDAGFCPTFGCELYFSPQNAYVSIDLYQSFISMTEVFTGSYEVSSRYVMPMIGAGIYLLPFHSPIRFNLGLSVGGAFGNELSNALFTAEVSAGLEFKFFENYILFAELNPKLHSPLKDGWADYADIYGPGTESHMYEIGTWSIYGFPTTVFGLKYKY